MGLLQELHSYNGEEGKREKEKKTEKGWQIEKTDIQTQKRRREEQQKFPSPKNGFRRLTGLI